MTWVKICGMTNLEDALVAVEAGADAVGFVFYEKSPRCVTVETAREIVRTLPESVERIGVFVPGSELDPGDVIHHVRLNGTQTYMFSARPGEAHAGGHVATGISLLRPPPRIMMALPMNLIAESVEEVQHLASEFRNFGKDSPKAASMELIFVLDSGGVGQPGGSGKTFDWNKAVPIADGMRESGVKLVVAGGLTPENVGSAISILQPWGVDVVSGVEASPGKKDAEKVRAFVKAVRDMDRKAG
jgi:phosphoribosylanthranilate isomerase